MQHAWNAVKISNNALYVEIKYKNKLEYLKTENKNNYFIPLSIANIFIKISLTFLLKPSLSSYF